MSLAHHEFASPARLDPRIESALRQFTRRRRRLLITRTIAAAVICLIIAALIVVTADYALPLSNGALWVLSLLVYAATATAAWWIGVRHLKRVDDRSVARQIESFEPHLREELLSAVELADPTSTNGSEGFRRWLQQRVANRVATLDVDRVLPIDLIRRWLTAVVIVIALVLALFVIPNAQFGRRLARAMLPGIDIERASFTRVEIVQPSPLSGDVAEGDAVAVVARITGIGNDAASLQWRIPGEEIVESAMSSRQQSVQLGMESTVDSTDTPPLEFAANLPMGSERVAYRVVAGDAITRWHTLTPVSRPHAVAFTIQYTPPDYTRLPARTVEQKHGDLEAITGSTAHMTVRFDGPISESKLRLMHRTDALVMNAVNGSDVEFTASVPIATDDVFQVDATSAESGLGNPFSPEYSIIPIADKPPVMRWQSTIATSQIASPIDVIHLSASAVDDIPIDRVIHEYQVNDEPLRQREVAVESPARNLDLDWNWDLLQRDGNGEETPKLESGDVVRLRVAAIDRKGQPGTSDVIELLIAEEGFDSDRHDRLLETESLTAEVVAWSSEANDWATRADDWIEKRIESGGEPQDVSQLRTDAIRLAVDAGRIVSQIQEMIGTTSIRAEAGELELCGLAMVDVAQELAKTITGVSHLNQASVGNRVRQAAGRRLRESLRTFSDQVARVERFARTTFAEDLTVAMVGDAMALENSLRVIEAKGGPADIDDAFRHLLVVAGRMESLDNMVDRYSVLLPESNARHWKNWMRWSKIWADRLQGSIDDPPLVLGEYLTLLKNLGAELRNHISHSMTDGRLSSLMTVALRELDNQTETTSERIRSASAVGQTASRSTPVGAIDLPVTGADFDRSRDALQDWLKAKSNLQRARLRSDLQYAADLRLLEQAINNVTQNGYTPYADEPAAAVHEKLATAFQVIESKHDANILVGELRDLLAAERTLQSDAVAKIRHATWLLRYSLGLERALRRLRDANVPWVDLQQFDTTRYNQDFSDARGSISSRRWSGEAMVSAERHLAKLLGIAGPALVSLEPAVIAARNVIEQYVLSLSEQARKAAQQATEAQLQVEQREDSQPQTASDLAKQQNQALKAAIDTIVSLFDLANNVSAADPEQLQVARDADIAASQIRRALRDANQAMRTAAMAIDSNQRGDALDQNAVSLKRLSETLNQTANHFERVEQGQDVSDSRQQLRQSESSLENAQEIAERHRRAESLSSSAQQTPKEMLERLEQELDQSQTMRDELSNIAERAAEAARRTLEQAARDETALSQSMERSDGGFQEKKRRVVLKTLGLSDRVASADSTLMNAINQALEATGLFDESQTLDQARNNIRDAVVAASELGGDQAVLGNIRSTAAEMQKSIGSAIKQLDALRDDVDKIARDEESKISGSGRETAQTLTRIERDARGEALRDGFNERSRWAAAERDAARRVQHSSRTLREAELRKEQLDERLSADENNADTIRRELEVVARQIDGASRAKDMANETRKFAESRRWDANQRIGEIQNEKVGSQELPNPAAELAVQMADRALSALSEIAEELKELTLEADFNDELRLTPSRTAEMNDVQKRIGSGIRYATDQLRRAARHEERVGKDEKAALLTDAADVVQRRAIQSATAAQQAIEQAIVDPDDSPEANRVVVRTSAELAEVAKYLGELFGSGERDQESMSSSPQSRRLAQTLDELDRSESEQQQPQSDEPNKQGPDTAGEASQTLSDAVDEQRQASARQRQQKVDEASGKPKSSTKIADKPGGNSTGSPAEDPTGSRAVDLSGVTRIGADWGKLRERRADEATEDRSALIAPQYRRQIEAYFRALADQAADQPTGVSE